MSQADAIAARREQVAQLVLARHSIRAIADDLGATKSTIHRDIIALRGEWKRERLEAMEQTADEELQRLLVAERAIWPHVITGDLGSIDRLLKIMERRAKMLGLDAPDRIEHYMNEQAERMADELGIEKAEVMAGVQHLLASSR